MDSHPSDADAVAESIPFNFTLDAAASSSTPSDFASTSGSRNNTSAVWIFHHLVANNSSSLKKCDVFDKYREAHTQPVSQVTFTKHLKLCFPLLDSRVANMYVGIAWADFSSPTPFNPDSIGFDLARNRLSSPTLRRIPKPARSCVADALTHALKEVLQSNSVSSWERLLSFAYHVIPVPVNSSQDGQIKESLATWTKRRATHFINSSTPLPIPTTGNKPKTLTLTPDQLRKKVEAKTSDGDIQGAVKLLSSSESFAPNNADTISSLESLNPPHPLPTSYPECSFSTHRPVSEEEVLKAILSFPPGSAGGLCSLRPQVLKDLVSLNSAQSTKNLLVQLSKLVDLLISGQICPDVQPIFFGASLSALIKKSGGIRPIAVGNTLRRLSSKIVCSRLVPELSKMLSPLQVGVGVPGGAEAAVHAIRQFVNKDHFSPKTLIKLDFKNAFNLLRRNILLQAVLTSFPDIYRYIELCYRNPSSLFYADHRIQSQRGVHQGDPLGPALFALTIQKMVEQLDSEINLWFLDDGTLADAPRKTLTALDKVIQLSEDLGLQLNPSKCELFIMGANTDEDKLIQQDFRAILPDIKILSPENLQLLGAPLTNEAASIVLRQKSEMLSLMSERLNILTSHVAFFLLRASVSIPRLNYFLRCYPCWKTPDALALYDSTLTTTLENILNVKFSEDSRKQSSLPVRHGGLGIRSAVDIAIPCFLASSYSNLPLIIQILKDPHFYDPDIVESESLWTFNTNLELPDQTLRSKQKSWEDSTLVTRRLILYNNATSSEEKARLLAAFQSESGAWLNALPSRQLGTLLLKDDFRISCALRLGCNICLPHICLCGANVTEVAHHGLHCIRSAGRRPRHEAVNDIIVRALRSASVPCIKEPVGLCNNDSKRPDGVTLVPWKRGFHAAWDFTSPSTSSPSHLAKTSLTAAAAAETAECLKRRKYVELEDRYLFFPIAVETLGSWGQSSLKFIKEIGQRISYTTGEKRASSFLLQRISIAIQMYNAVAVRGTIPNGPEFHEVFLL